MSNENDVNKLILDRRDIADDGCDHSASIIDNLNQAARARSRQPYQPKVKSIPVAKPATVAEPSINIGKRFNYGRNIVRGMYELSRLGRTAEYIAILLRMPLGDVQRVLLRKTVIQKAVYKQVMVAPKPTEKAVIKRLSAESKE
ncbi:hypothetical protein [Xenorhabdus japonica]|uniref:Uncharacterized protein n=1 Tax=Xenorhabdus japonica TaxID=53341 RepID=A0A1I5DUV2_9GAMM|nr:hypothetical protein [Xenorhabdus japonica]SFO03025.1 hypothetical protein SAMN05421579_14634 [Xenorhabdus japonica]